MPDTTIHAFRVTFDNGKTKQVDAATQEIAQALADRFANIRGLAVTGLERIEAPKTEAAQ